METLIIGWRGRYNDVNIVAALQTALLKKKLSTEKYLFSEKVTNLFCYFEFLYKKIDWSQCCQVC